MGYCLENTIENNAKAIAELVLQRLNQTGPMRPVLAIVGAPGSGKSSVAEQLIQQLNQHHPHYAALLPMDGFHYDDHVLDTLERRARKGAPDTFDVHGLYHLLVRLRENKEEHIAVPVFDRRLEIARAGARLISQTTKIIICEGNYLLLTSPPWNQLKPLFDLSVQLEVSESELRQRLTSRWQRYQLSADDIAFKVEHNDLPNGRMLLENNARADVFLCNGLETRVQQGDS